MLNDLTEAMKALDGKKSLISGNFFKANKIKHSPHKTQLLFDKHEIGFE